MTRNVVLFLILVFASPLFAATAQDVISQAASLRNQNQYDQAEMVLKNSLEAEPGNASLHFELANLYAAHLDSLHVSANDILRRGLLEKAAHEFEEVTALRPDDIAAHYNLGVVYKRLGEYEKARDQFRAVLEIDSKQASAHVQLGETYEAQGFFEDARAEYKTAKELNFGNESIDTLLHDLDENEKEANERTKQEDAQRSFARLGRGFNFAPGSRAALLDSQRRTDAQNRQGVSSAIPYLGAWLAQEFMKAKSGDTTTSSQ